MLRIDRVLGSRLESEYSEEIHRLEHRGAVDLVNIPVADLARRRLLATTRGGEELAIALGYHAGNLHWRVRFQGEVLFVALEGRPEDYTARLGEMISARRIGVSILDEEVRDGSTEGGAQIDDGPVAGKNHFHHDGH